MHYISYVYNTIYRTTQNKRKIRKNHRKSENTERKDTPPDRASQTTGNGERTDKTYINIIIYVTI